MPELPGTNAQKERLKAEISLLPQAIRADAAQEAWVEFLAGKSPLRAVKAFAARERRQAKRFPPSGDLLDMDPAEVAAMW